LAATRFDGLAASICFYGGQIVRFADEKPHCPTQMHFGDKDQSIPLRDVETIKAKRPDCNFHIYHGGHGFARDERASYERKSAELAWERSTEWLEAAFSQGSS
jgi:carboxymethylenebutenolidase